MSSVMLQGVLRMTPELWNDDPVSINQHYSRYIEAAEKLRAIEDLLEHYKNKDGRLADRLREILCS